MNKTFKNWLITNVISSLITTAVMFSPLIGQAYADTTTPSYGVKISSYSATPSTFDPENDETLSIDYCVAPSAYVTVGIYQPVDTTSSKKVDMLSNGELKSNGCYSVTWDGKNGPQSEIGNSGEVVEAGKYFYGIFAESAQVNVLSSTMDYKSDWIYVGDSEENELKVDVIDVENNIFDPEDNQEAEITFSVNKDAYITLEIVDEDNYGIVTLVDDKLYEKGEYTEQWNGEDMYGDIVEQGEYEFKLMAKTSAETDKENGTIIVKEGYEPDDNGTTDPRLKRVFATKDSFDPDRRETTSISFNLTAQADVSVIIYNSKDQKVEDLMDEEDVSEGAYSVKWEAENLAEGEYTYKVYAKNSKGSDTATGTITIEQDEKEDKKPNIYKDKTDQIIYEPGNNSLNISFYLDRDGEVTVEIRDGEDVVAEVVDTVYLPEGPNEVNWNGKDTYGEYLEAGVYSYKIIADNDKGKDTEKGNFEIQGISEAIDPVGRCGQFSDVDKDYKYCDAIEWAKSENIFKGYSDNSFRPNQYINRAEALKVILEAMDVRILNANGENLGFSDTNRFEWYASYIKTALSLGIVSGYPDGTFKPGNAVNRVEALVMLLNTAKSKDGIIVPTNTYGQPYFDTPNDSSTKWYLSYVWFSKENELTDNEYYFYPSSQMTRGEMADMLYRYDKIQ